MQSPTAPTLEARIQFRLTVPERRALEQAAASRGVTPSDLVRSTLRAADVLPRR
jgi:uncharacterized protein (DUF1778 family)